MFSVESVFTHIRHKSTDNFSNSVLQSVFFTAGCLFFIYKCVILLKKGGEEVGVCSSSCTQKPRKMFLPLTLQNFYGRCKKLSGSYFKLVGT